MIEISEPIHRKYLDRGKWSMDDERESALVAVQEDGMALEN